MFTLFASLAIATPTTVSFQGRALDALGAPVQGDQNITIRLYDDEADLVGEAVWTETFTDIPVDGGYFSVGLDIPDALLDGTTRWLGTDVGGDGEDGPRTALLAVPYARRAAVADTVADAPSGVIRVIGASEQNSGFSVTGQTWADIPGTSVTLDIPASVTTRMRAWGSVSVDSGTNENSHCGVRFVVDGTPYGNTSWGDVLVGCAESATANDAAGWWCPWSMERDLTLTEGPHTFSLQMTGWTSSVNACSLDNGDYSKAKLRVEAY